MRRKSAYYDDFTVDQLKDILDKLYFEGGALYDGLPIDDINAIFKKFGGVGGAERFLAGELVLVEAAPNKPEPVLDFLVRVDRSVRPTYPNWVKKLMHPELELAGPAEYDLSKVDQWLHDYQKNGCSVQGNIIYEYLQKGDALATCLNLQDGLAIQKKGIVVFRKLFEGKVVFLLGSVVQDRGHLVPSLYDFGDRVELRWHWLDYSLHYNNPTLRFSK